ncbi:MAG TPA: response regulator [Polyangiaceae bacterium]|jgi:two-component system chemotaxis response regulator CheY|nr:response regulator [Polyangiaceae bacterium]
MRILIVDDSSATRTFVREALEARDTPGASSEVVEADNGLEALRVLPRGPYSLVISDINMSGVNGLELLNFIRSNKSYENVGVLLISTQGSEKDKERGRRLGADGYLAKPFTADELRQAVNDVVAKRSAGG